MQLLFFLADYCPPCKQMQPVAEQFSIETGIPLYQFRCNDGYDGNALARQHHVKRLPCLILLGDDGLERTRTEALHTLETLHTAFDKYLNGLRILKHKKIRADRIYRTGIADRTGATSGNADRRSRFADDCGSVPRL